MPVSFCIYEQYRHFLYFKIRFKIVLLKFVGLQKKSLIKKQNLLTWRWFQGVSYKKEQKKEVKT